MHKSLWVSYKVSTVEANEATSPSQHLMHSHAETLSNAKEYATKEMTR